jgi:uncharacterized protein (TIGR02270 family)
LTPEPVSHAGSNGPDAIQSTAATNTRLFSGIVLKRALAASGQAAFLWTSRRSVALSSAATLEVLARVDDRLSRLVFKLSEQPAFAQPLLLHDQGAFKAGWAFVTAVVALRGAVSSVVDELLSRLDSEPALLSPLSSALAWLEYRDVRPYVDRLLAASSQRQMHLGLVAAVAHGVDPGAALERALEAEAPALRASALETVGRLALRNRLDRLTRSLGEEDDACRFWAAWSTVRLGDVAGIPVLGRFASAPGPFAIPSCEVALRGLDPDQAIRAHSRLTTPDTEDLAIVSAGIIGDPRLGAWLLDKMGSPKLARRAGAAFSLMSGCDFRRDDLDGDQPPEAAAAQPAAEVALEGELTAVSLEPVAPDDSLEGEDDLAWPDVVRLRQWWDGSRHAFVPGVRYLAGVPIRPAELRQVLRAGNQRQRAAAALEIALTDPDAILLDVTGPAHRQRFSV